MVVRSAAGGNNGLPAGGPRMLINNPTIPIPRWRPRYYQVGSFALGALGTGDGTFDLNQGLNDLATNARTNGMRSYIHHFVLRIKLKYPTVVNPIPLATIFQNILSLMWIKTSTSVIPTYLWPNQTDLTTAELDGLSVNPICYNIARKEQEGTTRYPVNYANDDYGDNGGLALVDPNEYVGVGALSKVISGKPNNVPNDTWNCASRFLTLGDSGAIGDIEKEYFVCIPACTRSGTPGIDPVFVDRLPTEVFTSPNVKALFNVGVAKGSNLAEALTVNGVAPATVEATVSLDAYVCFDLATDTYRHGVTWHSDVIAMTPSGQTVPTDLYRQIAVYPYPQGKVLDATIATYFNPWDFEALTVPFDRDDARVLWTINGVNAWPSTDRNFVRELVSDYNSGEDTVNNPGLYYERGKGMLFSGKNSSRISATVQRNLNYQNTVGLMTHMPILPLAFTNPSAVGFAPGFFGLPGSSNITLQIQLLTFNLSAGMVAATRKIVYAGSNNWSNQRDAIRMYEVYGSSVQNAQMPSWQPHLDSTSSARAALYSVIVPEFASPNF